MSVPLAFGIAFLAGLIFNVKPCVQTVLPLQAREARGIELPERALRSVARIGRGAHQPGERALVGAREVAHRIGDGAQSAKLEPADLAARAALRRGRRARGLPALTRRGKRPRPARAGAPAQPRPGPRRPRAE